MTAMRKIKKRYNWKDILERMLKTFIQGVLIYLITTISGMNSLDGIIWKSVVIGAGASGISAVMNMIVQELERR